MNISNGDVVAIPVNSRVGLEKVLYRSEYFKDVVLIKLYRKTHPGLDIKQFPNLDEPADLYYTSVDPIRRGLWEKVGKQAVSEIEKTMSKRIVGGDVWVADECIGAASKEDLELLPRMLTFGYRLSEKAVARLP